MSGTAIAYGTLYLSILPLCHVRYSLCSPPVRTYHLRVVLCIFLRSRYAMSGTDLAYDATRCSRMLLRRSAAEP
eukprot:634682-Rhodomonas_salina.1